VIYLDNNATTRPAEEVVVAIEKSLRENWGNPSSLYTGGARAREAVELARQQVAQLVGCSPREIILTSGGTESCNLALAGSLGGYLAADHGKRKVIVTTRFEHSAVRECSQELSNRFVNEGAEVVWLEGGRDGVIDTQTLEHLLQKRANEIAIVSVMWVNNETGVLQPIAQLGSLCRQYGVRFHTDATQWVGRMPTDLSSIEVDLLTLSAHKFQGPKGVGALYCRRGTMLRSAMIGGPQERDRRGGTENVSGIIGMGVAAELALRWLNQTPNPWTDFEALRNQFEALVCAGVPNAIVLANQNLRVWNTSNIAFTNLEAEAVLVNLAKHGVAASAGAACSSGSLDPSPVLLAMGVAPEIAHGAVRFSISRNTTHKEIISAANAVIESVQQLSRSMPTA
jgi:cysteine desulfurase